MAQIIIDSPIGKTKHFRLENKELAKAILASLEAEAILVKNPSLTKEDELDIRAAKRARKGELISWDEAKKFLADLD